MTARVADVLFPLALDQPYSYAVPDGLDLAAGDLVAAPLGPRSRIGVVWALRDGASGNLKALEGTFDAPPMTAAQQIGRAHV